MNKDPPLQAVVSLFINQIKEMGFDRPKTNSHFRNHQPPTPICCVARAAILALIVKKTNDPTQNPGSEPAFAAKQRRQIGFDRPKSKWGIDEIPPTKDAGGWLSMMTQKIRSCAADKPFISIVDDPRKCCKAGNREAFDGRGPRSAPCRFTP